MTSWLTRLQRLTQARPLVKGAVNYDEDLHFSTYYLRASMATATAPLYPGYSCVVASYENFNETYYLLKDECRQSAMAIVEKGIRNPQFLPRILMRIRELSDSLAEIFPLDTSPERLAHLSKARLLSLYRRHDLANRRLYRVARLPEALDRGDSYFTEYLHEQLRTAGVSAAACSEIFSILSQPTVPSVLSQEIAEFDELVHFAQLHPPAAENPGRARLALNPELYRRLESHREKWQYLSYHGYGRRQLASLDHYLSRLLEQLRSPREPATRGGLFAQKERQRSERQRLLRSLKIDARHMALFEIYPEIGAAKLYRRYAQLRNFYFLDMLLAEIAQRLQVSEWTVRCMLPEEVMASLQAEKLVSSAIGKRLGRDGCVYVIVDGREHIATGQDAAAVRALMRPQTSTCSESNILTGTVASRGKAAGPCRVVIRADDCQMGFAKGTILVSESTDPDLVPLLRVAGAVLTEQGGVTSHAAIICRELGIPTVIGIDDLLSRVKSGDWLEVDAERGVITRREPSQNTALTAPSDLQTIGSKAHNLGIVRSLGFRVPNYVVLEYREVQQLADCNKSPQADQLVERVLAELTLKDRDKLAVRSSAVVEDRENGSAAGAYHSLLNIEPQNLARALCDFITYNHTPRNGQPYQGSVIIQHMIDADWAGVCLTRDSRTGSQDCVIVEMTPGGNSAITGGTVRPDRIVVDRLTGDIREQTLSREVASRRSFNLSEMVQQFLTLESQFGKPLDIEWALAGQVLYILQVRPIVDFARAN